MIKRIITKQTIGMLSILLAFIIALNIVTPAMSESVREALSIKSHDNTAQDYTLADIETVKGKAAEQKEAAFDNGRILIYNYSQLLMIGSGESYTYEDGVTAVYAPDAEYKMARDIPLPRHALWQLPEGFTGKITGEEQEDAPLYDSQGDAIYLYNPYQLAVMAMDDADSQPVMSGDADAASFGSGKVICTDEEGKNYLTYSGDHNYVISADFSSEVSQEPVSIVKKDADTAQTGAEVNNASVGAIADGRDFVGQVIKKIGSETYILIGNDAQLRAIGTDTEVYSAVYQTHWGGTHHVIDTDPQGHQILLYGGDADLEQSQNGYADFNFHEIHDKKHEITTHYFSGVNQNTGAVYTDATHAALESNSLTEASWHTGEKYTINSNYIIFRDIDLGGQSEPWTPLMFTGNMYGIKSVNGSALWNGSAIGDATALSARTTTNRPVISNVYVNNTADIDADKFVGIGFFATITNEVNVADIGVSSGTVHVENIELNQVQVRNAATDTKDTETIVNAVTSGLGWIVGGVLDLLTTVLSIGSMHLTLRDTLSALLNAREIDPTIFATGAFAGRVVGDVAIYNCAVTGSVTVENAKDRTGGFIGYSEGIAQYSGLSQALGLTVDTLSSLLNAIPGLGLGDLITVLLDNALPLRDLIVTGYICPQVNTCEVNGLNGYIGTANTDFAGGFIGQQIATRIDTCTVTPAQINGSPGTFTVRAHNYGGGFCGLERDAEIKGLLDGLGIDLTTATSAELAQLAQSVENLSIHPQSVIVDSSIYNCEYDVTGGNYLGGFVGAMTSSYAVDCTIDCQQKPISVQGTGECVDGFAGYSTVGWQSSLGASENHEKSLLGTVRQLATGLLSSDQTAGQGQQLLSLMGVSPSAIIGCQVYSSELEVKADGSFAGGLVGKGDGIYLGRSDQAAYTALAEWNSGTLKTTVASRPVILTGLKSVTAGENYAGGIAGYMGSAQFQGLLNDVVGLGDFIGFNASDITVNGVDGGYTVTADNYDAGGGFGTAIGGTITNVKLNELQRVEAFNRAAGFVGIAGPGELAGTGGLTVNLLGLNYLLNVNNLLSIGQGVQVTVTDCDVNGISSGFTVEATGENTPGSENVYEFTAAGFIADSNSTSISDSHCYDLLSVTAVDENGFAGGFIGTSETGGLAEAANNDSTAVKSLIEADGLVNAIGYLIPDYTNCTANFVDGGYVDADIAGGFVADLESGTIDNSGIAAVDDPQDPKWTHSMKELYDPDAVNATGDLNKQFAVINIDRVHGRTYGGGFGGRLRSGALADAGGGLSILGTTDLSIGLDDLTGIMNAYVPFVKNAGVYSENGFTVIANTVRSGDSLSGSAGGFAGYMSGAQISNCDVYKLKNTSVTPPAELEAVNAPSYFDSTQSAYAVTGGHYAGGYVGNADIGDAASVGHSLGILGDALNLNNIASALSVVVTTIEHSDVQGAAGGFSVIADGTDTNLKVGKSGGYAGEISGAHIQNSHCKNFYYIIGQETAGGYVGGMKPGSVADLLDNASVIDTLVNVSGSLLSLIEDFIPTIRNSTTSCVPCGGAVRAQAASDSGHQRGVAGGYCGHNEGGHIWGLNTNTWERQNDGAVGSRNFGHNTEGNYIGERHIATAWRIRSVYGAEYAGGFTGFMESADTANTGNISLLGGLISASNVLTALKAVYPTEEHTAVYGPLRNLDVDTWNAWVTYVGRYGGYGAELAQSGTAAAQAALDSKLSKYIYGCNVAAGRSAHAATLITEGGSAGGYVGYMLSGVITDGQSYDMKYIRAMRNAGGYVGKMQTGGAASFGSVGIIGLNLNIGDLAKAAQVFVPTVKSGTVHGWQSGMTVESFGTDITHNCGYAGGYVGSAYGAQIWGDENAGNTAGTGCDVTDLRFVRGTNAVGGYVGMAAAAAVADVNTNSSNGLLQSILDSLVDTSGNLASVIQATVTTIRHAQIDPDNSSFGFTVGGVGNTAPWFAGGFAGYLEASVIGSRTHESDITVNGLRSADGLYYAGGFVGLADVGGVASVPAGSDGHQTTVLGLIQAGNVDLLSVFLTYIYYSDVNGVSDGTVIRAYESAPSGILSETRYSGCAGGFGGGIMNGTVVHCDVTDLNTVYAPNYAGGFIGHMGKNGVANVDNAAVSRLLGLTAGVLDVFGTSVNYCSVAGINAGAVITATSGAESISGGFAGYADDAQIKNSNVTNLKQVYSDQYAGGFVGKTNMSYLVEAEADSLPVQLVLQIVNGLIRILQVNDLEKLDLLNLDLGILGLKLLTDGDLLYVNLLGLRIGVSLVKSTEPGVTDTALVTIGDSTVALPCDENGITENPEAVVNLIKANRTRVENCSVTGISVGYDVYGGGASNTADGTHANGYAGGFVGYNNEGKFTSDRMVYCDVVRGTAQKVGTFSGTTLLQSVYSFNTLASIEKVDGEENHYSVYRSTDLTYALTSGGQQIATAVSDTGTGTAYNRFDITHLDAPITPDTNEAYYRIFGKWNGAKLASSASGADAAALRVYASNAKAVLMLDTPTYANDESLIPNPGEVNDPCGNIDFTVQKIWNDNNDKDQSRPDSIRVKIMQYRDDSAEGVPFTDSSVIPDVDTANGWFTVSRSEHGRTGSATWTRTVKGLPVYTTDNGTTHYYRYEVEEAPVLGYSSSVTYDETGATTTAKIVNTPEAFEIQFKYYDRYEINGMPSGIESTETVYSVSVNSIPKRFVTYDEETHELVSINFSGLIGEKAVEFSQNALSVTNVMCDYDLWTSQSAAASAMSSRSYFVNGEAVSYSDTAYHTDYLGKPKYHEAYSGQAASKDEKWVNYYDSEGKALEENFTSAEDYLNVNKIVVWCYNYPRQYNVDIYAADSSDDLVQKTIGSSTVYVANAISADSGVKHLNDHFYYNQRFGDATGNTDEDHGGFIENYGLDRYTGVKPADYAAESVGDYTFAYWAYDQEGTQVASVDRDFWYRVTNDTKLYAVYVQPGSTAPGISISANANDTFVDESGVSRTRLNILGSVYGAVDYDENVEKLSFVNISLSTQIRDNPTVYTPARINALFTQYIAQLLAIIEAYDENYGSKSFSTAHTYDGAVDENGQLDTELKLTLTTKGYIYTVVSNGNTPAAGDSTIQLTNKNRAQFTAVYKTSALNVNSTGSNGDTCLMYCAALKYNDVWSLSTNCLIYRNGEVVRNTATGWN